MATPEIDQDSSTLGARMPRAVAIVGGVGFIALGLWAMVDPRSFYEALASKSARPRRMSGTMISSASSSRAKMRSSAWRSPTWSATSSSAR